MKNKMSWLFVLVAMVSWHSVQADVIEFPEDELATESVLPVFDPPDAVKSRLVVTEKRFEIGPVLAYSLQEPFFNPLHFGGTATYHFTETQGLNLYGGFWMTGTTSYANQLNPPEGSVNNVNVQYAPAPKWIGLANYQYTPFYGKMSLTKNYVMNLSLFGFVGAGGLGIGDGFFPAANVGLGQKFYFGPNFALRFDMRMLMYQGPNPLSKDLRSATGTQPVANFEKEFYFSPQIGMAVVFLL